MEDRMVVLDRVGKCYGSDGTAVAALNDISLDVETGQFLALMGASGCGKSTLLNLISGIDTPTRGRVRVCGQELSSLSDDARSDLRLSRIGFVFQSFNLLPTFTAEENVAWPLELLGVRWKVARRRASELLERLGIARAAGSRRPAELSGGEQQRVAIARALVADADLLLADEPTGNLDSRTGESILRILQELNHSRGLTIVLATHSEGAARYARRVVDLRDGRIVRDTALERASDRFAAVGHADNGGDVPGWDAVRQRPA